jgi:hypothetical protein
MKSIRIQSTHQLRNCTYTNFFEIVIFIHSFIRHCKMDSIPAEVCKIILGFTFRGKKRNEWKFTCHRFYDIYCILLVDYDTKVFLKQYRAFIENCELRRYDFTEEGVSFLHDILERMNKRAYSCKLTLYYLNGDGNFIPDDIAPEMLVDKNGYYVKFVFKHRGFIYVNFGSFFSGDPKQDNLPLMRNCPSCSGLIVLKEDQWQFYYICSNGHSHSPDKMLELVCRILTSQENVVNEVKSAGRFECTCSCQQGSLARWKRHKNLSDPQSVALGSSEYCMKKNNLIRIPDQQILGIVSVARYQQPAYSNERREGKQRKQTYSTAHLQSLHSFQHYVDALPETKEEMTAEKIRNMHLKIDGEEDDDDDLKDFVVDEVVEEPSRGADSDDEVTEQLPDIIVDFEMVRKRKKRMQTSRQLNRFKRAREVQKDVQELEDLLSD